MRVIWGGDDLRGNQWSQFRREEGDISVAVDFAFEDSLEREFVSPTIRSKNLEEDSDEVDIGRNDLKWREDSTSHS